MLKSTGYRKKNVLICKVWIWLQTGDPIVVSILEADSFAPIMAMTTEWGDVFDITVTPAITAEDGLKLVQQMM